MLPGPYNITVEAIGFKTIHQNGVVVEVDQRARLDFALTVGSKTEIVTVRGSAPLLNTSDASVSTVIGNQFVENLPLNGRSFSSLIDLTPGVVLTPSNFYEQGQFSVNGQRPDANYFLVDGVSANLGTRRRLHFWARAGPASFRRPAHLEGPATWCRSMRWKSSAFRLPPLRRNMGALQALKYRWSPSPARTRFTALRSSTSATTSWMPTIGSPTPTVWRGPNCGRTISAACWAGRFRKDKLFFFGSYEGLRVRQPQVADTYVPSLASRQNAPAAAPAAAQRLPAAERAEPR